MTRRELIKSGGASLIVLALPHPFLLLKEENYMKKNSAFDVIIVGGSYAGLSAAMALGRSLRNVLVMDSGFPCNRYTPHSHNFITQDGVQPQEIADLAKKQVLDYESVKFLSERAVGSEVTHDGFRITTDTGKTFECRKLIFATGIKDLMPEIKGFSECWGKSVIHCPYCHGYEFRSRKTAILANGDRAFHLATLVKNLTDDVTIITSGKHSFTDVQVGMLNANGIPLVDKVVSAIIHTKGQVEKLVFDDGSQSMFDAVYAAIPFEQHSDLPASLGCELTEAGHIKIDAFQQTTIKAVFACGDNSAMMRSVENAVYSGNLTGAMVNRELADEDF